MKSSFFDPETLADAAADRFVEVATSCLVARRRLVVALAGGQTTIPVYQRLASPERAKRIDWRRVHVLFTDERCVPPHHLLSNYRTICEALLDAVPVPSRSVHRVEGEWTPVAAADFYEIELRDLLGHRGMIDLAVLGVGADGHIASLFPRHQALTEAKRWVLAVHTPAQPPWRVTMTLPLLNRARNVLFVVTGREKAEAYRGLSRGEDLPASRIRPIDAPPIWYVDASADPDAS